MCKWSMRKALPGSLLKICFVHKPEIRMFFSSLSHAVYHLTAPYEERMKKLVFRLGHEKEKVSHS